MIADPREVCPGLNCLRGTPTLADIYDEDVYVGSWCLWCSGVSAEPDLRARLLAGFTPRFVVRTSLTRGEK